MAFEDRLHGYLAHYTASPQWVKSTLGWLYAALPKSVRRGRDYRKWETLAAEREHTVLARTAEAKLRATLALALDHVPAYARYRPLKEHLSDPYALLARLPLVSKADIKRDPMAYVSTLARVGDRLETFTGGSTASPMRFFQHRHVTRSREYGFMYDFERRAGMDERGVTLALRGRTVAAAEAGGNRFWAFEPIKRQLMMSADHLGAENLPHYVAALRRFRPSAVQAFPSALYPLARWLERHPAPDVSGRVHSVMLYSETLHPHQLALFRKVFDGARVLCHYGHSERVLMAATMPDDDRFFFWPTYGHLELIDGDGRSVTEPGARGEIVGTGFDNGVMPFIRYRTEDLGVLGAGGHPRLPGFPVLERIDGRLQEHVITRDGRLISITTLGAAHFDELAEVSAIQYEQHEPGVVLLNVETPKPLPEAVRRRIAEAVRAKTQGGCDVRIVEVAKIARTARGKHRMLIQTLDQGAIGRVDGLALIGDDLDMTAARGNTP